MTMNITSARIVALNEWLDEGNAHRNPEARTWGRLAKVSEECGEVIEAFIGVTGQNPRKGVTHKMDDVTDELLDVALTALCAVEHVLVTVGGEPKGKAMILFRDHVRRTYVRAGLEGL